MDKRKKIKIPLAKPDITPLERRYVLEVLKGPHLSLGPRLKEFEEKIAEYIGVRYAIGVNSGTSGLHLIVRAMGIGEGDEVITTPFSFIASSNCLLFERARPVFVDIEPKTLTIDINLIEKKITRRTKAILGVDIFGHPACWDALKEISEKYGLKLIEDSAEALGSEYKGKKTGSLGDAGVFGFYPNKQITTGEGGVIVTNEGKVAKLSRSMRNQGRDKGGWLEHPRLGYNYRLSELHSALGIAQLKRIKEIIGKREKVAEKYNKKLKEVEGIELPYVSSEVKLSWFVYVIRLKRDYTRRERDKIIARLNQRGIECRAYFTPIHLQPFYRRLFGYKKGSFPVTESVAERTIALPFYPDLREEEIAEVVENLKEVLKNVLK